MSDRRNHLPVLVVVLRGMTVLEVIGVVVVVVRLPVPLWSSLMEVVMNSDLFWE